MLLERSYLILLNVLSIEFSCFIYILYLILKLFEANSDFKISFIRLISLLFLILIINNHFKRFVENLKKNKNMKTFLLFQKYF
jgi:hypothetical protein